MLSPLTLLQRTILNEHMEQEAVTREEVYAAIREFRLLRIKYVKAVVMELNGELTVIKKNKLGVGDDSLKDVLQQE